MKTENSIKEEDLTKKIGVCITRMNKIREEYNIIRDGYHDCFITNNYMFVKDIQALILAKEKFDNEYMKLMQTSASISNTDFKIRSIPMMIIVHEIISKEPLSDEMLQSYLAKIKETETEVEQIFTYLDEHEKDLAEQLVIFTEVTQKKNIIS